MSEVKDTQEQSKVEIEVKNFGPISEAKIDLRPLTVFVGPSNTGKTYFATLVYALQGTFYDLSTSGLLSLFEPGIVRSILINLLTDSTMSVDETLDILSKLNVKERSFKLSDLPTRIQPKLSIITENTDSFSEELQMELINCFDLKSLSELIRWTGEQNNEAIIKLRILEKDQEFWNILMKASESDFNLDSSTSLETPTLDELVLLPKGWSASGEFLVPQNRVRISSMKYPRRNNRYYLPAARSGIMQSHRIIVSSLVKRTTRVGLDQFSEIPTLSGIIAEFMQQIILYDEDRTSEIQLTLFHDVETSENQVKHLANVLESELLTGQVRVNSSASGYPDFRYLPHGSNKEFRLSQTSSMVSELAPLVLYLRGYVEPGDTLIIEEPEAHLHPGAQADMAVILARLVRAGVKVIITTHSDWLLQEIGNLVLEGQIDKEIDGSGSWLLQEEVGIWHFQKDLPVKEIPFDSMKGFPPKDYHDVAEGLYNRSVNLQQLYEKQRD